MPKRKRTSSSLSRARAIAAKINGKYPLKTFGRVYVRRGTADNIARFGTSYRAATQAQRNYRREMGYYGRGGYLGRVAGSFLAKAALNTPYAAPLLPWARPITQMAGAAGSWLEDKAYAGIKKLTGRGAYVGTVKNQLMLPGGSYHSAVMNTVKDETGDVVIRQREFLGDIVSTGSSNFTITNSLNLNPGLGNAFPWLAQLAQYFEEYSFHQLVFEYKSMVADGNANVGGTIIMATQYNPANGDFTSKQQMEAYDYACSAKVGDDCIHGVECDPSKTGNNNIEYIRVSAVPTGQDIKSFDHGIFNVAISGVPAAYTAGSVLGELWVNYTVKLSKAKLISANFVSDVGFKCASTAITSIYSGSSVTPSDILVPVVTPTASSLSGNNALGLKIYYSTAKLYIVYPKTLPTGLYYLNLVFSKDLVGTMFTGNPVSEKNITNIVAFSMDPNTASTTNSFAVTFQVNNAADDSILAVPVTAGQTVTRVHLFSQRISVSHLNAVNIA